MKKTLQQATARYIARNFVEGLKQPKVCVTVSGMKDVRPCGLAETLQHFGHTFLHSLSEIFYSLPSQN
jgi:hypothetical protein